MDYDCEYKNLKYTIFNDYTLEDYPAQFKATVQKYLNEGETFKDAFQDHMHGDCDGDFMECHDWDDVWEKIELLINLGFNIKGIEEVNYGNPYAFFDKPTSLIDVVMDNIICSPRKKAKRLLLLESQEIDISAIRFSNPELFDPALAKSNLLSLLTRHLEPQFYELHRQRFDNVVRVGDKNYYVYQNLFHLIPEELVEMILDYLPAVTFDNNSEIMRHMSIVDGGNEIAKRFKFKYAV